ncbi:hypothetical protein NQ317_010981 [Molorchus minor]|uniref:Sodium/potassium-transporting ATPase subunit beta-1-interacting protein n=1 Tax=Molorchus minor TaxID=1323400 RepID=A0ABQ9K2I2_9CUCU|nr:hypothetical protein NQ317_010981 [Molorchus minor]
MGYCTRRYLFLSVCLLQMVSVVQRQVFDFLGFLWIPILYLLWHIFWLGWNIFLICLYLNVGTLDHEKNKVLKLDLKSDSWWKREGPGCKVRNVDPATVEYEGCLVSYIHIEIFQAGLQCFFALLNCIIGLCLSRTFLEEDDTFNFEKPDGPDNFLLHPMYVSSSDNLHSSNRHINLTKKHVLPNTSASFLSCLYLYQTTSRKSSRKNTKQRMSLYSIEFSSQIENRHGDSDNDFDHVPPPVSPKPMTPRRVKRRSVMTRGSSGRHSTSSRRNSQSRSSTRSSRRMAQNPVTRLLEQQQKCQAYDSPASPSPIESPLSNYYTASNNNLISQQSWQVNGHTNPTYQQSSQHSLNDTEDLDELYNNRPASVRSSYSNFHGTRALNYSPPKHYHSHATPQVPQKRNNPNRNSMRSMAFLNNGPPAYTSQVQPHVDSETPIPILLLKSNRNLVRIIKRLVELRTII